MLEPARQPAHSAVEVQIDLVRALKTLSHLEREVVDLVYLRGHQYQEAAHMLAIPLGTLKTAQRKAMTHLREKMGISVERSSLRLRAGL